jgi:hypothetical protein
MDLPPGSGLRGEGGQSPRLVRGVDDLEAGQLAEALGELPVALEQATALLAKTGMAADEYLRLLRDRAGAPGPCWRRSASATAISLSAIAPSRRWKCQCCAAPRLGVAGRLWPLAAS